MIILVHAPCSIFLRIVQVIIKSIDIPQRKQTKSKQANKKLLK